MCSLQSSFTTARPPRSNCLTIGPSSGSFSILSLKSYRGNKMKYGFLFKKKKMSLLENVPFTVPSHAILIYVEQFNQKSIGFDCDLEELQLFLQAPEEGVFEHALSRRPPLGLHVQHLFYQVCGHDVLWERRDQTLSVTMGRCCGRIGVSCCHFSRVMLLFCVGL